MGGHKGRHDLSGWMCLWRMLAKAWNSRKRAWETTHSALGMLSGWIGGMSMERVEEGRESTRVD